MHWTPTGSVPMDHDDETNNEILLCLSNNNNYCNTRRGVQYVRCVMHKCIMVKLKGKRKTHKVCEKDVNFMKSEGKFAKVGEIIIEMY